MIIPSEAEQKPVLRRNRSRTVATIKNEPIPKRETRTRRLGSDGGVSGRERSGDKKNCSILYLYIVAIGCLLEQSIWLFFTELGQGMRLWLTPLLLLTVCVVFFYEMVGMENGSEL